MLHFTRQNRKLIHGQVIFDLPAGYSCPFAQACLCKANRITGKLTDGPLSLFRCYRASIEAAFKNLRLNAWDNFDALKACKTKLAMFNLLRANIIEGDLYRLHSGGDFFSQAYFDAWLTMANHFPDRIFYAYTKALPFWVKRLESVPSNFRLNASYGGTHDHLIALRNLKSVTVVNSQEEANQLGLLIDHDDSLAWKQNKSFALLLHGNGKPGSFQAKKFSIDSQKKKA